MESVISYNLFNDIMLLNCVFVYLTLAYGMV